MHGLTRKVPILVLFTVVVVSALGVLRDARGEVLRSDDLNYEIETPPGWTRLLADESWSQHGIVDGSIRELHQLKDGSPANGEGGELHLAITDAPEGRSLDDLVADPEIRGFFLSRFDPDAAKWPEVSVAPCARENGLEVRVLQADGEAANLKDRRSAVRAVLIVASAKGKLYKLRAYAWHSEFDAEGLKADLDSIEVSFVVPDVREKPARDRPGGGLPKAPEVLDGDEAEEIERIDGALGWRLVKPVRIKTREAYDREKYRDVAAWFEDNDEDGSYQFILYVVPRGRRDERNLRIGDLPLKTWALDAWWSEFNRAHERGPVHSYGWPRGSKHFLTLPDWERERLVFSVPKKRPKRPEAVDAMDLIRRYKVAEKLRSQRVGEEQPNEGYRGVLAGNRKHVGREWVLHYVWSTPHVSCYVVLTIARDGRAKWGDEIQKLLESIEMIEPKQDE